jgi:hypothetical protein
MVEVHIFPVKYTKTLSRDALDYRNVMKRQFCGEKPSKLKQIAGIWAPKKLSRLRLDTGKKLKNPLKFTTA